jgi:hypothetical protein
MSQKKRPQPLFRDHSGKNRFTQKCIFLQTSKIANFTNRIFHFCQNWSPVNCQDAGKVARSAIIIVFTKMFVPIDKRD